MARKSSKEELGQIAALPPSLLLRQMRFFHLFFSVGGVLVAAGMTVVVFAFRGGNGMLGSDALVPAGMTAAIGTGFGFFGWFIGRRWRAALRGDRPPATRRDFARAFQAAFLGIYFSESSVIITAIALLLGGHPALLAPLAVTLAFLLFQRVDPDRAAELVRHVESLPAE